MCVCSSSSQAEPATLWFRNECSTNWVNAAHLKKETLVHLAVLFILCSSILGGSCTHQHCKKKKSNAALVHSYSKVLVISCCSQSKSTTSSLGNLCTFLDRIPEKTQTCNGRICKLHTQRPEYTLEPTTFLLWVLLEDWQLSWHAILVVSSFVYIWLNDKFLCNWRMNMLFFTRVNH